MIPSFNPLANRALELETNAKPYRLACNAVADIITFANLANCQRCGELPEYTQPHHNPEHGEYSIAISCTGCDIQTAAQFWFITEPNTAIVALNAAIEKWNRRPDQAIAEEKGLQPAKNPPVMPKVKPAADPVTPAQAGIQQDAARYQEIKRILHSWYINFALLKGKPDNLVIGLSMAGEVIATDNDESTGLKIDLDQTIDKSIAATKQPEAAK